MASIAALEARLSRLQVCTAQEHVPEGENRHLYVIGGVQVVGWDVLTVLSGMTLFQGSGRRCRVCARRGMRPLRQWFAVVYVWLAAMMVPLF